MGGSTVYIIATCACALAIIIATLAIIIARAHTHVRSIKRTVVLHFN